MTSRWALTITLLLALCIPATSMAFDLDENFMLVLRESEGANEPKFGYKPVGPSTGVLDNGEEFVIDMAWFNLIGDIHVRFVVDAPDSMSNIEAAEFKSTGLTPEAAVRTAMTNIKKRYGAPTSEPWEAGIFIVSGDSPDFDSSYFLDASFWHELLGKFPDGLVVGVPKRGGLIYAPVNDEEAVETLERSIVSLYESSGAMRVSSALYRYDGTWKVHQAPGVSSRRITTH
ncbi:hypothetical protein [Pseudomarimonas salicorniae]|uniref:Uncharacterized protein n=1 Tax=Pseudomarimonas salicorniae TaxID=2933270 RepID=A0ABT0GM55_9GAMM|nr:hypothetical protein [Lysobacter sp. CAU 1642]MCK7595627.1 hypothetical protein [Lysobacter sp. CAU 1642]